MRRIIIGIVFGLSSLFLIGCEQPALSEGRRVNGVVVATSNPKHVTLPNYIKVKVGEGVVKFHTNKAIVESFQNSGAKVDIWYDEDFNILDIKVK